jgi:hypothetical protein
MSFDDFLNVLSNNPDFSELKEEDVKRIGWFDVEKYVSFLDTPESLDQYSYDMGIVHGFKKALELTSDRTFTLEEVKEALFEVLNSGNEDCCVSKTRDSKVRKVIQSLSQPKSWEVEYKEEGGLFKILKITG